MGGKTNQVQVGRRPNE